MSGAESNPAAAADGDYILVAGHPPIPTSQLEPHNITQQDLDEFLNFETSPPSIQEKEWMCVNLATFSENYKSVHGYICLVIIIFGAIANLLNIIVLTRKEMNGSPINRILTGMAIADITLIIEYLPFLMHNDLWKSQDDSVQYSWGWAAYMWFHSNFSIVIHNVSIWLTLTIAVWRFIMIKYHTLVPVYCTMERCHFVLISAYVGPVIISIPSYLTFTIDHVWYLKNVTTDSLEMATGNYIKDYGNGTYMAELNMTKHYLNFSQLAHQNEKLLFRLTVWLYSFIIKLIPSIVLTIFTGFLIHALYKAEERSARLKNGRNTVRTPAAAAAPKNGEVEAGTAGQANRGVQTASSRVAVNNNGNVVVEANNTTAAPATRRRSTVHGKSSRKKSTDRTTRLLIVILVLFLLTEFPQAILGMLSAIEVNFFHNCYIPLGDLMDDIALFNSSINFLIYYFMSRQFRKNFIETFGLTWCNKCHERLQRPDPAEDQPKGDAHEMRPLMKQNKVNPPATMVQNHQTLEPRRPPQNTTTTVTIANVAEVNKSQENGKSAEAAAGGEAVPSTSQAYILTRTNEPSQQI